MGGFPLCYFALGPTSVHRCASLESNLLYAFPAVESQSGRGGFDGDRKYPIPGRGDSAEAESYAALVCAAHLDFFRDVFALQPTLRHFALHNPPMESSAV